MSINLPSIYDPTATRVGDNYSKYFLSIETLGNNFQITKFCFSRFQEIKSLWLRLKPDQNDDWCVNGIKIRKDKMTTSKIKKKTRKKMATTLVESMWFHYSDTFDTFFFSGKENFIVHRDVREKKVLREPQKVKTLLRWHFWHLGKPKELRGGPKLSCDETWHWWDLSYVLEMASESQLYGVFESPTFLNWIIYGSECIMDL